MSDALFDQLARRLLPQPALAPELLGFGRAAVLVPLLDAPDGLQVLFTVRSAHLKRHAGQIAFPGGRVEAGEGIVVAALRETFEEVGLSVSEQQVLGFLENRVSPTGLVATPVVARLPWPLALLPDPAEVAEVFTLPVAALQGVTPVMVELDHQGERRRLWQHQLQGRCVWGLTGTMLHDLLTRLRMSGVV